VDGVMLGGLIASGRNVVLAEDLIPKKKKRYQNPIVKSESEVY